MNYYGGKFRIAPWIIEQMPPHDSYVEVFGGALSVFMQKPRVRLEVVNDIDRRIVNLYRSVRDASNHLGVLLDLTPYAREEFMAAKTSSPDPVEDARRVIVASYLGVGNSITEGNTNGFRTSKTSNTSPSMSWRSYMDGFSEFHERISGAIVENLSWEAVLDKYDAPDALFYLDPPYVTSTRSDQHATSGYQHEMNNADHEALITRIQALNGMVVLSGYDSEIYQLPGWQRAEREALTQKGGKRTEVLWLSPACVAAHAQQRLL